MIAATSLVLAITTAVTSPNFTVLTDAGEALGKSLARELEQMRLVFAGAFPDVSIDPPQPIVVFAVTDEGGMATLLPEIWEDDERRKPDGVFRQGADRHFIALQLDAPSDRLYSAAFHEYFHLLTHVHWGHLPLWLDEGLAKFWETTSIAGERVRIGVPGQRNVDILAREPLLPIPVLLAVDHESPYYVEADKSLLFYAQSWALVHYLLVGDATGSGRSELSGYIQRVREGMDAQEALHVAFRDLDALGKSALRYARQQTFPGYEQPAPERVPEEAIQATNLSEAEALAHQADFLVHGETPELARPLLEDALGLNPETALAHEGLGYLAILRGHTKEALEAFGRAAALDASSFVAHYYYAVAALRAGLPMDAIFQSLDRAILANPDFAPAHLFVATAVLELGDHLEQGLASARRAVALTPEDPEAYHLLGRLLVESGDEDSARDSYRRALELPTTDAARVRELGLDLFELELVDEATRAFEKAQALAPNDPEVAFVFAIGLADAGRVEDAIVSFERATVLAPDVMPYHYRLAELLVEEERYAEAVAALERCHELDPESVAVRRDLGQAFLRSGRAAEAISHLRAALEKSPHGVIHHELGLALSQVGEAVEAERHFERARELGYEQ